MPLRQGSLAPEIDAYLRKKGSPLAGLGSSFVQAGEQYGIDPRLIVAISGAETSFGTYGPSQRIHNPFGMGPGINYPTYGSAIAAVAKNLRENYYGQGLDTIAEIQKKWAPSGAENDPTGLNNNWVKNVAAYYAELGGQASAADPGKAESVAQYGQTAAALESQYADVGTAPDLKPLPPTPAQKIAALDLSPKQLQGTGPLRAVGELTAGLSQRPLDSTPVRNQGFQDRLKEMVGTTAAKSGLDVHWDPNTVVAPNTPAYIAAAADYVSQKAANVVQSSQKFLGTPYVWGGESPGGFDCSGFVQYLYGKQGVQVPRTTYEQWKVGQSVKKDDLEPGDIVFFRPGPKGPEHEGLYIGHGQFIHAPHTGDVVKISSMSDPYYTRNFMGGRRVTR